MVWKQLAHCNGNLVPVNHSIPLKARFSLCSGSLCLILRLMVEGATEAAVLTFLPSVAAPCDLRNHTTLFPNNRWLRLFWGGWGWGGCNDRWRLILGLPLQSTALQGRPQCANWVGCALSLKSLITAGRRRQLTPTWPSLNGVSRNYCYRSLKGKCCRMLEEIWRLSPRFINASITVAVVCCLPWIKAQIRVGGKHSIHPGLWRVVARKWLKINASLIVYIDIKASDEWIPVFF